jgi:phosphoesterase RecJ-like protein
MLSTMECGIDRAEAEALYCGILTDTGNCRYSNTTAKTHRITAALYEYGIDASGICVTINQNNSLAKTLLNARAMRGLELFAEGRAASAYTTLDMLDEVGATLEDTDGIVDTVRDLRGVDAGVFFREIESGVFKISMRAKVYTDVGAVCESFGGGGHKKAAGCTVKAPLETAKKMIYEALEKQIEKDAPQK